MTVLELDERSISDAIHYFRTGEGPPRTYAAGRINFSLASREVNSYGSHFPLFRYVPKVGRQPETFIINGDEWRGSNSRTRDHQSIVRRLIAATGVRSVIVPFSAIGGSGILVDSIRPIHVRDDARWLERHEIPLDLSNLESAHSMREVDERKYVDYRGEPCKPHGVWFREYTWKHEGAKYTRTIYRQAHTWEDGVSAWRESAAWGAAVAEHAYRNGSNELVRDDRSGVWFYLTHHHRLGDALISAVREVVEPLRSAEPFESGRVTLLAELGSGRHAEWCDGHSGHVAGPSGACIHCEKPLLARVTRRLRARYLSSFDMNEFPPLYFLAQCPKGCGDTVESALDSLAPRAVHAAMARGRDVKRQGDVFFIASDVTRDDLVDAGAMVGRLTLWTRQAKPRKGEPGFVTESAKEKRSRIERMRATRRREYLRLIDEYRTSTMERYQMQPIRNPYSRVERAYARDRAAMGAATARVWNTGDGAYLTDGNRARAAWWLATELAREKYTAPNDFSRRRDAVRKLLAVYGTAHSATEVARMPGGAVYVRGIVRHVPELEPNRSGRPDHRPLKLGEGWYLAVRNTVPRATRRRRRRATTT